MSILQQLFDLLRSFTDPDRLIHLLSTVLAGWWGYAALFAIVFAETGLLVGFFLPGDSMLFTIGVVAGAGSLDVVTICILLAVASVLGDQCGYLLGYRTGPGIFKKEDGRFFKREYLTRTQAFYDKHGGKTLIYAKFVPIIRTFAPFMAGVAKMNYLRFLSFNVFGGIGWVVLMTLAGYKMGKIAIVRQHFEKFVILVVLISVLPILFEFFRSRTNRSQSVAGDV